MKHPLPTSPFGTVLGYGPGRVPAYSCDYDSADDTQYPDRHAFRNYIDGVFMGYKWQCVEFARRWLYLNKGYIFDDIAMAYDIFRLRAVRVVKDNQLLPLKSFANGSRRRPEPGCMLIWAEGGEFERTGHVAIVTDVFDDHICFVEQNVHNHIWPEGQHYSRSNAVCIDEQGGYWIQCEFEDNGILGWVIQTEDHTHAVQVEEDNPSLLNLKLVEPPQEENSHTESAWLNTQEADQAAFVAMMGGHRMTCNPADLHRYFYLSDTAEREIKHASNELHAMFMHATHHVLQHEENLEQFNIPTILWPKIRKSWANRANQMIVGRMDFSLSDRGIKIYEYNADSASCLMECGKVQDLWAQAHHISQGHSAGKDLFYHLVNAWTKTRIHDVLHILQDDDLEESYHALYMQSAIRKAGINSLRLKGLQGLTWSANGDILDPNGHPIRWVWKTWAWETALDQIRAELSDEDQEPSEWSANQQRPPRLADVLLHPNVMVYEPLWTLIPSNKAILPVLCQLFPDHPYLLDSQYRLTDSLKNKGYVIKPIAGRCGANISIVDRHDNTMAETSGQFDHQQQIYQELHSLPKISGRNVQTNSFVVDGKYAGTCIRVDESLVINSNSDILALRILADDEYKSKQE